MNRTDTLKENAAPFDATAFADVFLLDKDNRSFVKGYQPYSPTKPMLWKPVLFFGIGAVLLIIVVMLWSEYVLLRQTGVVSQATITDVSQENPRDNLTVVYSFSVDGNEYRGQWRGQYDAFTDTLPREGSLIDILYVPTAPYISSTQPIQQPNGVTTVFIVILVIVMGNRTIRSLRVRDRQGDLSEKGYLLKGQVREWHTRDEGEQYVEVDMKYAFTTPDGRPVSAELHRRINYWNYKYAAPPTAGTPLAILYVNDTNYRVL
ncbi:MAG: hypothetical protein H7175_01670 [Burkholderiales bacterium]|nr:hypothetical protein [Anaerolineae bacterium]